jgi:uncharacterized protein YndB with AHSA1/START domain
MAAHEFHLVTDWHLDAPIAEVWRELNQPEHWPEWWRAVKRVVDVAPGDAAGIGAVRRFTWTSALPYELTFDMTVTRVEPNCILEGRARGELDGVGLWTLAAEGTGTHVRYDWRIEVTKPWQRAVAPILRPAFTWNHNVVMAWGFEGLCKRLGIAPSSAR